MSRSQITSTQRRRLVQDRQKALEDASERLLSLFEDPGVEKRPALKLAEFDGETYEPDRDGERLRGLLGRVFAVVKDGRWWTLRRLAVEANGSEASVSARLRDLRKPKFGGYEVQRRYVVDGLWEYRLVVGER